MLEVKRIKRKTFVFLQISYTHLWILLALRPRRYENAVKIWPQLASPRSPSTSTSIAITIILQFSILSSMIHRPNLRLLACGHVYAIPRACWSQGWHARRKFSVITLAKIPSFSSVGMAFRQISSIKTSLERAFTDSLQAVFAMHHGLRLQLNLRSLRNQVVTVSEIGRRNCGRGSPAWWTTWLQISSFHTAISSPIRAVRGTNPTFCFLPVAHISDLSKSCSKAYIDYRSPTLTAPTPNSFDQLCFLQITYPANVVSCVSANAQGDHTQRRKQILHDVTGSRLTFFVNSHFYDSLDFWRLKRFSPRELWRNRSLLGRFSFDSGDCRHKPKWPATCMSISYLAASRPVSSNILWFKCDTFHSAFLFPVEEKPAHSLAMESSDMQFVATSKWHIVEGKTSFTFRKAHEETRYSG